MGGNTHFNGIDEVTIVYPLRNSVKLALDPTEASATYGYEAGAVTLKVTPTVSDDVDAAQLTYQWYGNTTASNENGTAIAGATSATYAADGLDAGLYYFYAVASGTGIDGAVSATSDVATVTIGKAASTIAWADGIDEVTSSNSVALSGDELTVVTGSDAGVKYAISTGDAPAADSDEWQDSATFTGLEASTEYSVFAMVPANSNYEAAVSGAYAVSTKDVGIVENPALAAVTYSPVATLADIELPEGWAWVDGTVVPTVKGGAYAATFTPTDTDTVDYADVEGWDAESGTVVRDVALTVNKATPTITQAPEASAITYGQTLADSQLSGGAASVDGVAVDGAFAWASATVAPSVADSGSAYAVVFTPEDTDNYSTAETQATVTVNPADASTATVSGIADVYDYTGEAITPAPVVKLGETTLVAGTDYSVAYANNTAAGDASYTVTFTGNYAGTPIQGTFFIKPVIDGEVIIDPSVAGEASADDSQLDAVVQEAIEYYAWDPEKGVIVKLEVGEADKTDPQTQADIAKVEEAAAALGTDYQIGEVYDVTLTANHGVDTTDIGSTNTSTISVVYTYDFNGKKNVVVFRVHDGVVEQLSETPNDKGEYVTFDKENGKITVTASGYSTFAIAYEPADEPNKPTPASESKDSSTRGAVAKTGDAIPPIVPIACGLIAVCACAAIAVALRIRKNQMR